MSKNSYAADVGKHDDLVMNLVLMSYFISTPYFEDLSLAKRNFKENLIDARENELLSIYTMDSLEKEDNSWLY